MAYIPFNQIVDALTELDEAQKQMLLKILQESKNYPILKGKLTSLESIREACFHDGLRCPHCLTHGSFKKNGTYRGRQRYFCHACRRTFNDLTGTPVHQTHYLDKWPEYLKCMEQGLSIRKSAKRVCISVPTSFAWRHKILHALFEIKNQALEGIVEVDETYVLYSEKGKRNLQRKARKRGGSAQKRGISNEQVCVLVARDRTKQTISEAVTLGRLDAERLDQTISSRLQSKVTLCTDEEQTFRKYCRTREIQHEKVNPSKKRYVIKEIYHIQNVNAYHERLKSFLSPFRGVASKYLNHYLSWHRFMDKTTNLQPLTRVHEMFLQSLQQPMKTVGSLLPKYCDDQFLKLVS
jgi:transposase-like protein